MSQDTDGRRFRRQAAETAWRPGSTSGHPLASESWLLRLAVTVGVGLGAGVGGMLLALLLHLVQHIAYGYSLNAVISPQTFLAGVSASSPTHRVLVLLACGAVAGVGWWGVYRFGQPLVSIGKAMKSDDPRMPIVTTCAHALLQIVTVALGSPLGREVAPREVGATFAVWLSRRARLSVQETRTMIACGAGAGLAAVYNVPLGGALFVLEVLTGTFSASVAVPALATCVIAATVAWAGLGDETQYSFPHIELSAALVAWSILAGPLFGAFAYGFSRLTSAARANAPRDWRIIPLCLAVFLLIGLAAMAYPQLLGNGKGPLQQGFDGAVGVELAVVLLALKLAATAGSLRAGAEGGLLTPGMAIGALAGIILGGPCNLLAPTTPPGAFAIVGAAAFLASSMRMPLTAIVLVGEFTRVDHDFYVPIVFAVAGSTAARWFCERRFEQPLGADAGSPRAGPRGVVNPVDDSGQANGAAS